MKSADETTRPLGTVNPDVIRNHRFNTAFRGYDTAEVRAFLDSVADAVATYSKNASAYVLSVAESVNSDVAVGHATDAHVETAADDLASVQEARVDAASIIAAAKDEANSIVARANDEAARIFLRARAESRGKPSSESIAAMELALADAPSDPSVAKEQARIMISEAKAVRERILTDLAKRRRVAHVQLEQLRVAREKLLESFRDARRVADEASRDLSTAEVEARLAAETAGRRVGTEDLPTVAELEAELFSGRSLLPPMSSTSSLSSEVSSDDDPSEAEPVVVVLADHPVDPDSDSHADAEVTDQNVTDQNVTDQNVEGPVVDGTVAEPTDSEAAGSELPGADADHAQSESDLAESESDLVSGADEGGAAASEAGEALPPQTHSPAARLANVDDLFARLRHERESAAASAHELLDDAPAKAGAVKPGPSSGKGKKGPAKLSGDVMERTRSGLSHEIPADTEASTPTLLLVDLTEFESEVLTDSRFDPNSPETLSDDLFPSNQQHPDATGSPDTSTEFEFVAGTLQAQCTRAMKRFLQDEQSRALSAVRTARGRVTLEELLGDADVRDQRLGQAVQTYLLDAYRAGADLSSQPVHDESVTAGLKSLEVGLASTVTGATRDAIDQAMNSDPPAVGQTFSDAIADVYRSWPSERLSAMVAEHLRAAFQLGHGLVH